MLSAGQPALRDLPWRRIRDPWAVLVSEVMLQQTQVARVVPRFERFVQRWPTPADCAGAALGEVLSEWQGLGYPRRARNLWLAAQLCVADHDGHLPDTLEGLLELPGVGPYTARAVLAFAHEDDVGVVDTNIARILARRSGRRLTPAVAQAAADALVPEGRSWLWNQVLMDLGATRCRSEPRCAGCPIGCAWRDAGFPDPDPATGSAGVSTAQARFEGSARQARGRLLRALHRGPVGGARLAEVLGWSDHPDRDAVAVAESLVADGLARRVGSRYHLP